MLQLRSSVHPASYRVCPTYQETVARRMSTKIQKSTEVSRVKETVAQLSQSLTNPGVSYDQVAGKTLRLYGCLPSFQFKHQRFPRIGGSACFSPPPTLERLLQPPPSRLFVNWLNPLFQTILDNLKLNFKYLIFHSRYTFWVDTAVNRNRETLLKRIHRP